jgi:hypothetical protein
MNGEEALNTSRPVLFERREESGFACYGAGSAVLLDWEGRGYVVTAKHVTRQGSAETLRIARDDDSLAFFRFETELIPKGDDEDWKDLAFYRVHEGLDRRQWAHLALPLNIADLRLAAESYRPGTRLWLSGYPSSHRSIDYDLGHIEISRCLMEASYVGPDTSARGKHRIRIDAAIDTFDGLSGSPVFMELNANTILLAGILIQGSVSSGLAHFVGAVPLAAMLTRLHERSSLTRA